MYTLAATIVWGVLQPSNMIAILAALALFFAILRRPRAARRLGAAAALLLILFGLLPTGQMLIKPLENRYRVPAVENLGSVAGIIVLGGAESPGLSAARDAVTLKDTAGRLTTALALARLFPDAMVVATAGYRAGGLTQAEVAGRFFIESGLDPHRLILEDRSHNTYDNAVLSKPLAAPEPGETWLLVTSAFHMPRARAVFETADWTVIPYPTDYRSLPAARLDWTLDVATRLREADLAIHEWIGLAAYHLMGRTDVLFPAPSA